MVTLLVSIELTPEPVKSTASTWKPCFSKSVMVLYQHQTPTTPPPWTSTNRFVSVPSPYSAPVTHTNVPHHVTTYISLFYLSIYVWKNYFQKAIHAKLKEFFFFFVTEVKGINIYKNCEMWMQTIFDQIMFKVLINWSLILINVYPKINANKQS